ncbi:hypothetical protein [Chloracidobacterium aggregatum]|jgi:hypothetical protein|uniref:Uncharacterized protein n=1 Tax=Chloracidobacterium sp. N TaxID=2821540 RepID=A0ABX8B0F0_9BACT|nr:hypothetical protein [Chloracidobacterium aggregatum]QUV84689.1 hypothetical protein J8C03_11270 [Chloracidobacterium sp. 2]QUV86808.1 hypothetical protein J8C07_06200 [Chloracidobacterium sp. S]QUV91806.1 hypothetical protein J8C04_05325 [Chloracidobacterium sp. A]QUV92939.1 hypothetical protein J8C05_05985 [Chloracidobacterium sp. N]QUV96093.1 hypothetical protein J8C00_07095 [Chloracidobacterium sp. E]
MNNTEPSTSSGRPNQTAEASLEAFRTLSLPEKALTIAQAQATLFSNTVVRVLSTVLRGSRPSAS